MVRINEVQCDNLRSRVFIALHMHAGDGNVHTNLPVNSDDYAMLREANAAVARIMMLARSLGGVISGEHGIGITKLEYLTADELAPFAAYKARVDPKGRFNARKLLQGADLGSAYTPSFALIGHESLILVLRLFALGADLDLAVLGDRPSNLVALAQSQRMALATGNGGLVAVRDAALEFQCGHISLHVMLTMM